MVRDGKTVSIDKVSIEIDRCYRVFNLYNNLRMTIIKKLAPPRRYKLVSAIPYLLHVNHKNLPGYVPELEDGAGLYGFKLTDEIREVRKDLFGKNTSSMGPQSLPKIVSLALIGSTGTMAQEEDSDFDFWLTCDNSVSDQEYDLIHQKAQGIERWLYEMDPDLECNIYMGTPDRVKNHFFGAVSDDGAGSALGKMLKEEFYRTCVVWTGKMPFWWCLPKYVNTIEEYEKWWKGFSAGNLPFVQDVMDMGPLERSTPEQFLSAVLWQTNKSLKQPFKSILKLSLVNRYADNPDGDLLAERVRDRVQENPTGDSADPYMMLFETCAEYWRDKRDWDAVTMMAQGYYIKTLVGKSAKSVGEADSDDIIYRRRRIIRDLMREWGLDQAAQMHLNKQAEWDISTCFEHRERSELFVKAIFDKTMIRLEEMGVKFVDGKVERGNDQVSEETLNLLTEFSNIGHKVDCFYGRSFVKIEPIPPGFQDMLSQQSYSIIFDGSSPRAESWILSQDLYSRTQSGRVVRSDAMGNESTVKVAVPEEMIEEDDARPTTELDTNAAEASEEESSFLGDVTDFLSASDTVHVNAANEESATRAINRSEKTASRQSTGPRTRNRKELILGKSALYIATWLAANRLANANSEVRVSVDGEKKPAGEIRKMIGRLANFFRHKLYQDKLPESTFENPPRDYKYFIYFDLLSHGHLKIQSRVYRRSKGTTSSINANESQIQSMSILIQDSYGVIRNFEVPAARYSPGRLMARILQVFSDLDSEEFGKRIQAYGADTPFYDSFVTQFIGALKSAHMEFLSSPIKEGECHRFITRIDDEFYVMIRDPKGNFEAEVLADMRVLISYLEQPLECPTRTVIDPVSKGTDYLRAVLSRWVPGLIQVYVSRKQSDPGSASLLLLDEAGALYHEVHDAGEIDAQYGGMTLFIARLNRSKLPFAARKEGKIIHRGFNMLENNRIGDSAGTFHIEPRPLTPTKEVAQILAETVYVKLHGSLNLNEPHRAELIARGELRRIVLPADTLVATLAEEVGRLVKEFQCRDFSILELGGAKGGDSGTHTLEFLTMRRALDRTIRRLIMSKTTSKVRKRSTSNTTRKNTTGNIRRDTNSGIIKTKNTGRIQRED